MHATAVVTDTALLVTEGLRDEHRRDMPTRGSDMPTPWRRARTAGISGRALADRNVDMPVESVKVDIPVRQLEAANVDPAAICLPDAYVDEFKPDSSGLVPGIHVLQHGGKGGNRTDRRSGGQHQQGGTGR